MRAALYRRAIRPLWECSIFFASLALLVARPILATDGLLEGTVYEAGSGQRLAGANVQVLGTVLGTVCDRQGRFAVGRVPEGVQRLRVTMIGYREAILDIRVPADESVRVVLEPAAIALNPVVVTAERRPQALEESSTSVTMLDRGQISARFDLRIDDALEMVPGVYFIEDDINIRGATGYRANAGNRVLLLLDGVPVISSDTGGISWDIIPVHEVERAEVVKGAGSALWGSGAIGGVVNVITRPPNQVGTLSVRTAEGVYDDPSEEEWDWTDRTLHYERVDLGYSKAFGPTALRLAASRYASTSDRQAGDFNKWTASGKISWRFADASELELYLAWLRDHSGIFVQWRSPFVPDSTDTGPGPIVPPAAGAGGGQCAQGGLGQHLPEVHPPAVGAQPGAAAPVAAALDAGQSV